MALSAFAKETAMTAISQMGGHAALNAMLGLKVVAGGAYLIDEKDNKDIVVQFDFKAANTPQVKRVIITYLYGKDLYDMELWKGLSDKAMIDTIDWSREQLAQKYRVAYYQEIYGDQLRALFSETTGLSLNVPKFV